MTVNSELYSNLSRQIPILNASLDPIFIFISQEGHSMRFCVDVPDGAIRSEALSVILDNGGNIEDDSVPMSPFTTILVHDNASKDDYDRVVFRVSYVFDCIRQRRLLPLGSYAVGRTISDTFYDVIYYRTKVYKNLRIYDIVETDGVARYETLSEYDEPRLQPSKRKTSVDSDSSVLSTRCERKKSKFNTSDDRSSTSETESSDHQPRKRKFQSGSNSSAVKSRNTLSDSSDDSIPTVKFSSDDTEEETSSGDSFKSSNSGPDSSSSEMDERREIKKKSSKVKKMRKDKPRKTQLEKAIETTAVGSLPKESRTADISENKKPSGVKSSEEHEEDPSSGGDSFKSSIAGIHPSSAEVNERSKLSLKKKPSNKIKENSQTSSELKKSIETITLNDTMEILHDSEDSPEVAIIRKERKKPNRKVKSIDIVVLSSDSEDDDTSVVVIQESDDELIDVVKKVNKKAEIFEKENKSTKHCIGLKFSEHKNDLISKNETKEQKLPKKLFEKASNNENETDNNEDSSVKARKSQKSLEEKNDERSQKMEKDQTSPTNQEESSSRNTENGRKGTTNNEETSNKGSLERQNSANKGMSEECKESGKQDPKLHDKNIEEVSGSVKDKKGEKSADTEPEEAKKEEKSSDTAPKNASKGEESKDSAPEKTNNKEKSSDTDPEKKSEKANGLRNWIAPLDGLVKSRPIRSVEHCVNDPDLDIPSTSNVKSVVPPRRPYTRYEQEAILMYIIRKNAHLGSLRSNVIWRKMEKADVCKGRTWQSLKNHFLKTLVHELDRYPFLNSDEKELMRGSKH